MVKFSCSDYGYECEYSVEDKVEEAIKKFAEHTLEEHGIEYSKEVLMQFVLRK